MYVDWITTKPKSKIDKGMKKCSILINDRKGVESHYTDSIRKSFMCMKNQELDFNVSSMLSLILWERNILESYFKV